MEMTSGCVLSFSASIKRRSAPVGILFQSNWEYSVRLRFRARLRIASFKVSLQRKTTSVETNEKRKSTNSTGLSLIFTRLWLDVGIDVSNFGFLIEFSCSTWRENPICLRNSTRSGCFSRKALARSSFEIAEEKRFVGISSVKMNVALLGRSFTFPVENSKIRQKIDDRRSVTRNETDRIVEQIFNDTQNNLVRAQNRFLRRSRRTEIFESHQMTKFVDQIRQIRNLIILQVKNFQVSQRTERSSNVCQMIVRCIEFTERVVSLQEFQIF